MAGADPVASYAMLATTSWSHFFPIGGLASPNGDSRPEAV